jgi:ABC-type transport system substrate-binding protein
MRPWSNAPRWLCLVLLAALALASGPAGGQTPKRGGILNAMLAEDPPGFSIHESSTISGVWPLSRCYSNLVLFDPLKPQESAETVIPELAERWSWQDNYRNLVFFLRKNVRWHDGQPFKLEADVARPMLGWRKEYFTQWPYVKNLVPHNALYNYGRMQDVWLDK